VSFQENSQAAAALKKMASTWQINVIEDRNGWIADINHALAEPAPVEQDVSPASVH